MDKQCAAIKDVQRRLRNRIDRLCDNEHLQANGTAETDRLRYEIYSPLESLERGVDSLIASLEAARKAFHFEVGERCKVVDELENALAQLEAAQAEAEKWKQKYYDLCEISEG